MGEPPTLTELDDSARAVAMACYDAVLSPHLEGGGAAHPCHRRCRRATPNGPTVADSIRAVGLAALARQLRVDRG